ncbi:hypothetical protein SDC9_192643 [bioreactor metagenome]|uniref:Uncharacterized protein n=1 Tax=bioreactor metagenome TaxID=1076179 RepID=A0A645I2J7_9ZZZZ
MITRDARNSRNLFFKISESINMFFKSSIGPITINDNIGTVEKLLEKLLPIKALEVEHVDISIDAIIITAN